MNTLADKFRPKCIDDIVGQEHILGEGKVLRRLIETNNISNIVLFGPPGTGKTTIAQALCTASCRKLYKLNGTTASVKDIQNIAKQLNTLEGFNGIVLYIDEFHAFSKSRQSSILSYLESGEITLITSTTENPYHSIHPAILSRCMVYELKPLENDDIVKRLKYCINEISEQSETITFEEESLYYIANISDGDLRKAIGILEIIIKMQPKNGIHIDNNIVKEVCHKNIVMDKTKYYDYMSMMQKSIRGSNCDAALVAMCALIQGGVELTDITRRLAIIGAEESGLAMGNMYATFFSLLEAAKMVGYPEASIILSTAVILVSTTPKSNSAYTAIKAAMDDVKNINIGEIQPYLRDGHYKGAKELGISGYKYPHDYPNNYVEQEYMPENLKGRIYYKPGNNKYENSLKEYWDRIKNNK